MGLELRAGTIKVFPETVAKECKCSICGYVFWIPPMKDVVEVRCSVCRGNVTVLREEVDTTLMRSC